MKITLWHTTKHENVESILRDGFKDQAHENRGIDGRIRRKFDAGVWVGDVPAIDDELFDGVGLFGFDAMKQAFIAIDAESGMSAQHWIDPTWPGNQWLARRGTERLPAPRGVTG